MWKVCSALALLLVGADSNATEDNSTLEAGVMAMKVQGQSGKITLYKESEGMGDPNKVVIEMSAIREVDANGNAVGTSGATKHAVNTLASQTFTWASLENFAYASGAAGVSTNFTAELDVGKFGVEVVMITAAGAVGPVNETWTVNPGDMKFNIFFPSAWTWCDPCAKGGSSETGAYIDVEIVIKGSASTAMPKSGANKSFDLGGDFAVHLANSVTIDDAETTMPEGFPSFAMQGSKQVFTFRFPKFNTMAFYDPVISSSSEPEFVSGTPLQGNCAVFVVLTFISGLYTLL